MSAEWVGISIAGAGVFATIVGGAIAYGKVQQKVNGNAQAHRDCQRRREEMEQRIFDQLNEVSKTVSRIEGKLEGGE